MFKILVADDERNIRNLFKLRLEEEGYEVLTAENGNKALQIVYANVIDLCIVDVMMAEMDGFAFVEQIRKDGFSMPIIMVTAKNELQSKKTGFLVGTDDYMVKPVEFDELLLRMKALFRRAKIVTEKKIEVGDTVLTLDTLTVRNDVLGLKAVLPKRDFFLLYKLLSYPERTFTKSQLFDEFWGPENLGDMDAVKVYISKIRSTIAPFPEIDIETVRGIGYRGVRNEKA